MLTTVLVLPYQSMRSQKFEIVKYLKENKHVLFFSLVVVCLWLGIPLWVLGCNPFVASGCLTKNVYQNATPTNWTLINCSSASKSCFSYSLLVDLPNNSTCHADSERAFENASLAEESALREISQSQLVLVDKYNGDCSLGANKAAIAQWYLGIIFMLLSAWFMFLGLIHCPLFTICYR